MSFAKAKRFNYKPPDLSVSPADYNIQTNNLEKGIIIPKCPRFQNKKFEQQGKSQCQRLNCSKNHAGCFTSSVKNILSPEKNARFNKTDTARASVRVKNNRTKASSENSNSSDTSIKNMIENFEKLLKRKEAQESSFLTAEEFIDDDYHSLTSSEELENLRKIEEYEFNEVCNTFKKLMQISVDEDSGDATDSSFENAMIETLEELEKKMGSFKQDFSKLNKKLQVGDLEKKRNMQRTKVDILRRHFEKQISKYSKEKQDIIKNIITKAMENLNREFDNKRLSTLREIDNKIRNLIGEIYMATSSSGKEIKELCDITADNLTKRLRDVMRPYRLALTGRDRSNLMVKEKSGNTEDSFNYENICKTLYEQMQLTQDEKNELNLENLNMSIKNDSTISMMDTQISVIDRLNTDIAELKSLLNGKHR